MANSITLFKKYVDMLDEVYKLSALTAKLDSDPTLARAGANANEIIIPKISMDGLGDYDRASGYTGGDVTVSNETVAFNYDRGRKFTIDVMDNEETAGIAFGRLMGEFIRTKVVPESDAFTFAKLFANAGDSDEADLTTGAEVVAALRAMVNSMDEAEVPAEDRHLFITPTLLGLVEDLQTIDSKSVLNGFATITKVPQTRFYTAVTLLDGSTTGQESGGYEKTDTTGKNLNFLGVHKPAVMKYDKHVVNNVIPPELNADSDGYIVKYRKYGLVDVYENKTAGIYASYATT